MTYAPGTPTAERWPIGVALHQFPGDLPGGGSLTDADPAAWAPTLREVALAGFTEVDLTDSWVRPADLSPSRRQALVAVAADEGLVFSAVSVTRRSVVAPDEDRARANLDYALRSVEATAQLGAPVLCLGLHEPLTADQRRAEWFWHVPGHADPDDPERYRLAVERYREVGRRAGEVGVAISLEVYEDTYLGTSQGAVRLVEDVGLDNVGLNPDIGNLIRLHRPVEHWRSMLERMLPWTNYWQVKNYLRDVDPATGAYLTFPAPLETGVVDYRTALAMALRAGFTGPLCVEHYGGDQLSVCATNRDYLRRVLAAHLAVEEVRDAVAAGTSSTGAGGQAILRR